jgi:hypothetical protein
MFSSKASKSLFNNQYKGIKPWSYGACTEELADEKQVVGVAAQRKWLMVAWKTILEYQYRKMSLTYFEI